MKTTFLFFFCILCSAELLASARVGMFTKLRQAWTQIQMVKAGQQLATVEIDSATAEGLQGIGVQMIPNTNALPAIVHAQVILLEYEAMIAAVSGDRYSATERLQEIWQLSGDAEIVAFDGKYEEVVELSDRSIYNASDFYIDNVRMNMNEKHPLVVDGRKNQLEIINLSRILQKEWGVSGYLIGRIEAREKFGKKDFSRALKELGSVEGTTPPPRELADGSLLNALVDISAEPIHEYWGNMTPIGVEAKAKIFTYAALVALSQHDHELAITNIRRILSLDNEVDHVQVSSQGGKPLTEEVIKELSQQAR